VPTEPLEPVLRHARRLAGDPGALTDAQLLERFASGRDEAAFEVLLWRHGPAVLGVCWRVLRDSQDAEDAFQATFLTLARKAASIRRRDVLGGWLYRVAWRIALAARQRRQAAREQPIPEIAAAEAPDEVLWRDLRTVLDEEVRRLPEKYRSPVVLCYLQGRTNEEAARELGCPPSTLAVRLLRARERLRARLARRGLAPCAALLATELAARVSAAVPSVLVSSTVRAGLAFAAGTAAGAAVPPAAAALARRALRTMLMTRIRNGVLGLAALALLALAGAFTYQALAAQPEASPQPQPARQDPPRQQAQPRRDAPPGDVAALAKGNSRFAVELYDRLRKEPGKNLFLSPHSISTALGMTYAGARGQTQKEMARVLHFGLGQDRLHPAFAELARQLEKAGKVRGCRLEFANALWGQAGHPFLGEFVDLTREHYGAGLMDVDFVRATEPARQAINLWVDGRTQGRIKDLLPKGVLTVDTRLVLTNAVYFLGCWEKPFPKQQTRPQPFDLAAGGKIDVPMMQQDESFRYFGDERLQGLELPYKGDELTMVLLLPRKADGLPALEDDLAAGKLDGWLKRLLRERVMVYLPRFKVTSEFSLKQVLSDLGMSSAFEPGSADFAGMDGRKQLFIQAVVHKAFVEVNEVGTEAAAATGVAVGDESKPPSFRADRPFLFLIRHNRTGAVLFLGRVVDPR
jgi:serpin B